VTRSPAPENEFLGEGDGVTRLYKLISQLILKNTISRQVTSDCAVCWREGTHETRGKRFEPRFMQVGIFCQKKYTLVVDGIVVLAG